MLNIVLNPEVCDARDGDRSFGAANKIDFSIKENSVVLSSPTGGQGAYLLLMATTGFIRAAWEAGIIPANTPTTIQIPIDKSILDVEIKIGK